MAQNFHSWTFIPETSLYMQTKTCRAGCSLQERFQEWDQNQPEYHGKLVREVMQGVASNSNNILLLKLQGRPLSVCFKRAFYISYLVKQFKNCKYLFNGAFMW